MSNWLILTIMIAGFFLTASLVSDWVCRAIRQRRKKRPLPRETGARGASFWDDPVEEN